MEFTLAYDMLSTVNGAELYHARLVKRHLRDKQNPFDVPTNIFIKNYRLDQPLTFILINELESSLSRRKAHGLPVALQVLCALQFFGTGSFQSTVGNSYLNCMSQTSVSRCVRAVSQEIVAKMTKQWIKFPITPNDRLAAKRTFGFPGALGAIDCTHISIIRPTDHEEDYINHHGFHSLNVQAICNGNLEFLSICPKYGGSRHDAFIWKYTTERRVMEIHYRRGERKTWLIGDSGYPLEPWLMTPINHADPDTPQRRYTEALTSARSVVERAFGVLKMRWRSLSNQRVLHYQPEVVGTFVVAIAVLHNMCIKYNVQYDSLDEPHTASDIPLNVATTNERSLAEGRRVQAALIRQHFH